MAKLWVGNQTVFESTDEEIKSIAEIVNKLVHDGGGWLGVSDADKSHGCAIVWISPTIPVFFEFGTMPDLDMVTWAL